MDKKELKNIVDYGLTLLEEKPDSFVANVKNEGPDKAIVAWVAEVVSRMVDAKPESDLETVLGAAVALFGAADRILIEAKIEIPPKRKAELISETIKFILQRNPSLHKAANELAQKMGGYMEGGGDIPMITNPLAEDGTGDIPSREQEAAMLDEAETQNPPSALAAAEQGAM